MLSHAPLSLYEDDENGELAWQGYLRGHMIRLVYSPNHPYEEMKVYVLQPKLPVVNLHIHSDGSICYMKNSEWHPEWTAYAVYLTTIRFLDEFYSGRMT